MVAVRINRSRWFKRPWFYLGGLVVAGIVAFVVSDSVRFVACSVAQLVVYGAPQPADVDEADHIFKLITTVHTFAQNSISQPDRPPVYSNPGSKMLLTQPTEIGIYGVTDPTEQDKVIAAVNAVVHDQKFKPVELRFIDHENWIVTGNEGERGPELQLRRVLISQSGTQEEGGSKTITY